MQERGRDFWRLYIPGKKEFKLETFINTSILARIFVLNKTSNDFKNQIRRCYEPLLCHAFEVSPNQALCMPIHIKPFPFFIA